MASEEPEMKKFVPVLNLDWTKRLYSYDVFEGLLDHGLFCEKLPPCFTTFGLSRALEGDLGVPLKIDDPEELQGLADASSHDFMRYEVLRDVNVPRHVGIPHPESYAFQARSIEKHWEAIWQHCELPELKATRIYVRPLGDGRIFEMNYKGPEGDGQEEDLIRWCAGAQFKVKADISACFPSIYTHSLPWALHGKDLGKTNRELSLAGNLLDAAARGTRDCQTNGLLIGPHSSNILSEIVLTSIDEFLQKKGYLKFCRYIDDYEFYAESYDKAQKFVRDLGLALRDYELALNEKKTEILPLPAATEERWISELRNFSFPSQGEIWFSKIRTFLDLALEHSKQIGKSTPLNYALKVIPKNLDRRAKRLTVAEAINLTLAYPYLATILEDHVFRKFHYRGIDDDIVDFATKLCRIGLERLYPDAIAHALYFSLSRRRPLELMDKDMEPILELNDCVCNVLLLKYAKQNKREGLKRKVRRLANNLKTFGRREQDQQWLLIYHVWTESDLRGNEQVFLAELQKKGFKFLAFPTLEGPAKEGELKPPSEETGT